MSDLNRREFVAATAVAACACAMGTGVALGQDTGSKKPPATEPGVADVGPLTQFAKEGVTATYAWEKHFYLINTGGKLTAMSSVCTHKGCMVEPKDAGFHCPCHGQNYDIAGAVAPEKKTKVALTHFSITVNDKGNVIVDTSKLIDATDDKNPEGSVTVK